MHSRSRSPSPDEILLARPPPPAMRDGESSAAGGPQHAIVQNLMAMETSGFSEYGILGRRGGGGGHRADDVGEIDEQLYLQRQAVEESFLTSNPAALLNTSSFDDFDDRGGGGAHDVSGAGSPQSLMQQRRGPRFGIERVARERRRPGGDAAGSEDEWADPDSSSVLFRPAVMTAFEIQQQRQQQHGMMEQDDAHQPHLDGGSVNVSALTQGEVNRHNSGSDRHPDQAAAFQPQQHQQHQQHQRQEPPRTARRAYDLPVFDDHGEEDVARQLSLLNHSDIVAGAVGGRDAGGESPSPIHPSVDRPASPPGMNAHHLLASLARSALGIPDNNGDDELHQVAATQPAPSERPSPQLSPSSSSPQSAQQHRQQQNHHHRPSPREPPPTGGGAVTSVTSLVEHHRDRFWDKDIIKSSKAFSSSAYDDGDHGYASDHDQHHHEHNGSGGGASGGKGMTFERYMREHFDPSKMKPDDAAFFSSLAQRLNFYSAVRTKQQHEEELRRQIEAKYDDERRRRHAKDPASNVSSSSATVFSTVQDVKANLEQARQRLAAAQAAADRKARRLEEDQHAHARAMAQFPQVALSIPAAAAGRTVDAYDGADSRFARPLSSRNANTDGSRLPKNGADKQQHTASAAVVSALPPSSRAGARHGDGDAVAAMRASVEKAFRGFRSEQRKEDAEKMAALEAELRRRREERDRARSEAEETRREEALAARIDAAARTSVSAARKHRRSSWSPTSSAAGGGSMPGAHSPSPTRGNNVASGGGGGSSGAQPLSLSQRRAQKALERSVVLGANTSFADPAQVWEISRRQTQLPQLAAELKHDMRRFRGPLLTPSYQDAFTRAPASAAAAKVATTRR